jgi:hypothetical protein
MQQFSDNIRTTSYYHGLGNDFPDSRDGGEYGYQRTYDGRRNGVEVANDSGTPYELVPPPEVPQSSGWSFASLVPAFLTRANSEAHAEGGSSARITGRAGNQRSSYGKQKSVYSEHPYYKSPKDANEHYSPDLDDLHQYPVHKETSVNEYEVRLRKEIERLQDRYKDLEKHYVAKAKEYHVEKIHVEDLQRELHQQQARADALEKDNRKFREGLHQEKARADALEVEISKFKSELAGLRQVKARADAHEKEISKYKSELAGLQQQATVRSDALEKEIRKYKSELAGLQQQAKARGDAFEKEINKYKSELAGLDRERTRAAALEKENKENSEGLSVQKERADNLEREKRELEEELQGLQSKLQNHANALAAKELEVSELKNHQSSWKDILTRENQALTSWKSEQQRKMAQDTSTAGQLRTKVADLTYSKGQMEKKEQQLINQVEEQTKRIEDLKQQNAVLMVKMGALQAQVQSLSDRLQNERQKNADLEELKKKEKPKAAQVITDDREVALKAQCSALEEQVQSKEILLRESTSKLLERLRQCDLEIEDLKQHIQYLETRDSQELLSAPINGDSFPDDGANPYLLDRAVQRVHEVAGIFSRLLMKAMEQGKIDGMAVARNTFVCSISSGKGAPLKYVLEAITCKLLFQGFEHECFDLQDSTSGYLDMEQQRIENFNQYKYLSSIAQPEEVLLAEDSLFTHFCRLKLESLSSVIPEIESMVQEIISRTFERSLSASEDTSTDVATYLASKLGSTFVKLAVCVWQVHKLAFAFNPMARIFRVSQSEEFVEKYMTSVIFQESESEDEDMPKVDISRVDFMVVPGFLINNIVIPSRVFVVTKPPSSPFTRNGETQHL